MLYAHLSCEELAQRRGWSVEEARTYYQRKLLGEWPQGREMLLFTVLSDEDGREVYAQANLRGAGRALDAAGNTVLFTTAGLTITIFLD